MWREKALPKFVNVSEVGDKGNGGKVGINILGLSTHLQNMMRSASEDGLQFGMRLKNGLLSDVSQITDNSKKEIFDAVATIEKKNDAQIEMNMRLEEEAMKSMLERNENVTFISAEHGRRDDSLRGLLLGSLALGLLFGIGGGVFAGGAGAIIGISVGASVGTVLGGVTGGGVAVLIGLPTGGVGVLSMPATVAVGVLVGGVVGAGVGAGVGAITMVVGVLSGGGLGLLVGGTTGAVAGARLGHGNNRNWTTVSTNDPEGSEALRDPALLDRLLDGTPHRRIFGVSGGVNGGLHEVGKAVRGNGPIMRSIMNKRK